MRGRRIAVVVIGQQFGGEAGGRLDEEEAGDQGHDRRDRRSQEEHLVADEQSDRQEGDAADVPVGPGHAGDLTADPLLHERDDGEHGARPRPARTNEQTMQATTASAHGHAAPMVDSST